MLRSVSPVAGGVKRSPRPCVSVSVKPSVKLSVRPPVRPPVRSESVSGSCVTTSCTVPAGSVSRPSTVTGRVTSSGGSAPPSSVPSREIAVSVPCSTPDRPRLTSISPAIASTGSSTTCSVSLSGGRCAISRSMTRSVSPVPPPGGVRISCRILVMLVTSCVIVTTVCVTSPRSISGPLMMGPVKIGPVRIGPVRMGPFRIGPLMIGPILTGPIMSMSMIDPPQPQSWPPLPSVPFIPSVPLVPLVPSWPAGPCGPAGPAPPLLPFVPLMPLPPPSPVWIGPLPEKISGLEILVSAEWLVARAARLPAALTICGPRPDRLCSERLPLPRISPKAVLPAASIGRPEAMPVARPLKVRSCGRPPSPVAVCGASRSFCCACRVAKLRLPEPLRLSALSCVSVAA